MDRLLPLLGNLYLENERLLAMEQTDGSNWFDREKFRDLEVLKNLEYKLWRQISYDVECGPGILLQKQNLQTDITGQAG